MGEPTLLERIADLERRIAELEREGVTGLTGTDQTIKDSHDRLDSILGAGKSAPDGTLVTNFNADMVDGIHAATVATANRLLALDASAVLPASADMVDGLHAASVPTAGALLALDANGTWPDDVVDFGALTTDAQVYAVWWTNDTLWSMPSDTNWNSDSQSTSVSIRRKSTVLVVGQFVWTDYTSGRIDACSFRWNFDGVAGPETGPLGTSYNSRNIATVLACYTGVTAGSKTLVLQSKKNYASDGMWVINRRVAVIVIPED